MSTVETRTHEVANQPELPPLELVPGLQLPELEERLAEACRYSDLGARAQAFYLAELEQRGLTRSSATGPRSPMRRRRSSCRDAQRASCSRRAGSCRTCSPSTPRMARCRSLRSRPR
jgi:hypothetical protein